MQGDKPSLVLPLELASPVDLFRTINKLENLENSFVQNSQRAPGEPTTPPKTSRLLELLASTNNLNLLNENHRKILLQNLQGIRSSMANVHISFATSPGKVFTEKILSWFRQNVHPHLLIQTGLQPNIVAGCVLRTHQRTYDLSLKRKFAETKLSLNQE